MQQVIVPRASPESARSSASWALSTIRRRVRMGYRGVTASRCSTTTTRPQVGEVDHRPRGALQPAGTPAGL